MNGFFCGTLPVARMIAVGYWEGSQVFRCGLRCRFFREGPSVIPAKAGIHFDFRFFSSSSPRRRGPSAFAFFRAPRTDAAFVPVGFRPPSWRPGHFLCLHKESNQRNAPSVTRRPRSGRFAAVGWGLAAGLLPCRQMRAIHGAPRVRCTRLFPADLRRFTEGPESEEQEQRRWVPAFAGTTRGKQKIKMDSGLRRNDGAGAFAGMTENVWGMSK